MEDPGATVHRGSTRAGDYDLLRRMGAGGFGTVYEARHRSTGLPFAVKRILLSTEDAERFRKEALYPARIAGASMHVLGVHSFFHDDASDAFFLVTELIAHGDLRAFLDREPRPLPLDLGLDIAIGIGLGLAAIHDQQIVHRDLKPANVLMDRKDGRWVPKIADFGLARSTGSVSGADFATSGYAAPEQLDLLGDTPPGPAADLFSYGMVLYEVLTGTKPTAASNLREYGRWLATRQPPPPPSRVRPDLAAWPEIDALLGRLLQFEPAARLASAAEAVRLLERVRQAQRRAVETPLPPPLPIPVPRPVPRPHGASPSRGRILLGMSGVFAITGAAMFFGQRWQDWGDFGWLVPDQLPLLVTGTNPFTGQSTRSGPSAPSGLAFLWDVLSGLVLPALFGLALALAARLTLVRILVAAGLTRLAFDAASAVDYLAREPIGRTAAGLLAGAVGAVLVLVSLAVASRRRPALWYVPVVAAIGAAGGWGTRHLPFVVDPHWLGNTLTYMAWQVPVGLLLVVWVTDRPGPERPPWRWRPFGLVVAVALVFCLLGWAVRSPA